jgi:addiction module HigA family antidote
MNDELIPARLVPPGRILRQELEARGWTQKQFSEIIDLSEKAISAIVNGRKQITPENAIKFAAAFNMSARFWMNLEANYRLQQAVKAGDEADLDAIRQRSLDQETFSNLDEDDEDYDEEYFEDNEQNDQSVASEADSQTMLGIRDENGTFVVEIPDELCQELQQAAQQQGVPVADFVQDTLLQTLNLKAEPGWSRLREAAYRSMFGAGMLVEPSQITEAYFADWIEEQLNQSWASIQLGELDEGLEYLGQCKYALTLPAQVSPLVAIIRQLIEVVKEYGESSARVRRGNVNQQDVQYRLNSRIAQMSPQQELDAYIFTETTVGTQPF